MRIVLGFLSLFIAAPFLGYTGVHVANLASSGLFSLGFAEIQKMWLLFLFLGASLLIGLTFLVAGVLLLGKPRRKP